MDAAGTRDRKFIQWFVSGDQHRIFIVEEFQGTRIYRQEIWPRYADQLALYSRRVSSRSGQIEYGALANRLADRSKRRKRGMMPLRKQKAYSKIG